MHYRIYIRGCLSCLVGLSVGPWEGSAFVENTVTLRSSAFQGTRWFYALEWKCLRANIESTTENGLGIFSWCFIGVHCLIGGCLGAGYQISRILNAEFLFLFSFKCLRMHLWPLGFVVDKRCFADYKSFADYTLVQDNMDSTILHKNPTSTRLVFRVTN